MTAAAEPKNLAWTIRRSSMLLPGLRDFHKSMPSDIDPAILQDVYKPIIEGRELNVKFTLDARGELLLISFKENEP